MVRSIISSVQSVAVQPVAAPELDADAPGGVAVIGDLLVQGHQLIPGLGDCVAGCIPGLLGIPDQALAVEAVEDAGFHAVDGGHVPPALVVLLRQPVLWEEGGDIDDFAGLHELGGLARLREVRDIGCIAGIHAHGDRGLEFLVADVVDVDAGGVFKRRHGLVHLHAVGVVAFKGSVHGDGRSGVRALEGLFRAPPGMTVNGTSTAGAAGASVGGGGLGRGGWCLGGRGAGPQALRIMEAMTIRPANVHNRDLLFISLFSLSNCGAIHLERREFFCVSGDSHSLSVAAEGSYSNPAR